MPGMMGGVRYADYATTPAREVRRKLVGWLTRSARWLVARIEQSSFLVPWWERRAGPDYTGWAVRNLRDAPASEGRMATLRAGEVGTVVRREIRGGRRRYVVAFARTDYYTNLPAPGYVELLGPPQR